MYARERATTTIVNTLHRTFCESENSNSLYKYVNTSHSDLFQSKCLRHAFVAIARGSVRLKLQNEKMNNYNHISSEVHTRLNSLHTLNGRKMLLLIMGHTRFTLLYKTFEGTSHNPLTAAAAAILIRVHCVRCPGHREPISQLMCGKFSRVHT